MMHGQNKLIKIAMELRILGTDVIMFFLRCQNSRLVHHFNKFSFCTCFNNDYRG